MNDVRVVNDVCCCFHGNHAEKRCMKMRYLKTETWPRFYAQRCTITWENLTNLFNSHWVLANYLMSIRRTIITWIRLLVRMNVMFAILTFVLLFFSTIVKKKQTNTHSLHTSISNTCDTAKCIDSYIQQSVKQQESAGIDKRLQDIVERMFDRCFSDGEFKQALGIAIESRRLDKVEESINKSGNVAKMLSYCFDIAMNLVTTREFRNMVCCQEEEED